METRDGKVKVALTATMNPVVMYKKYPQMPERWVYADSDFWLSITEERFIEIRQLHWQLLHPDAPTPAAVSAPAPSESLDDLL